MSNQQSGCGEAMVPCADHSSFHDFHNMGLISKDEAAFKKAHTGESCGSCPQRARDVAACAVASAAASEIRSNDPTLDDQAVREYLAVIFPR